MKKIISITLLLISIPFIGMAQEQPLYTEYMFNGLVINPAYSGTDVAPVLTLSDREQWVGLDGAPKTTVASFYAPVQDESNLSLGGLLSYDRLGVTSTLNGNVSAAYRVQLNNTTYMSLGIAIGAINGISKLGDLGRNPTTDPMFANNEHNLYGNIGLGAMLFSDKFYVGISAPQLQGFLIQNANNGLTKDEYMRHFYLTGGYLFQLNRSLDLKPNILIGQSYGTPVVDANLNLCINKIFWVGASYRVGESVSLIFQYSINSNLQIGYSYDYGTSAIQNTSSRGSHEIMLSYRFIKTYNRILTTRWF